MSYSRFALYYLPPDEALAAFGAAWLGWDVAAGRPVPQPALDGIDAVTATPRKYGCHGTLKPPFALADGHTPDDLARAVAHLAASLAPARADGLALGRLGHFLALVPNGDGGGIARVAAACVRGVDAFRAPPDEAELAHRRAAGLSARQERMLATWGYPYVMEEFRFHITLTGRLAPEALDLWNATLRDALPPLPAPFDLDTIALVGERRDGCFELIQRYALTG
ncbi:DUF1045 domain-containing protein [Ovoidimarina sediminis]|uniref:DUF1045 domain-containing protein n=1 Tax=Ovoidimarina sediminis TaxID=3079856 RepID=UPI002908E792|nr:DUF1045 domain-containing protein [Rhodophyticola sp. MJ-SS7]MDU8943601.1 DUF1045 domain-containing protein [Rhodophyticola sp. MJ-SS7]